MEPRYLAWGRTEVRIPSRQSGTIHDAAFEPGLGSKKQEESA
jgi:hypothetical protein